MQYQTGDKVKIINKGKHYSTYEGWAKAVGAKYYKNNAIISNGEVGEVIAIGPHSLGTPGASESAILVLIRINNEKDIIIGVEGIEGIELSETSYKIQVGDRILQIKGQGAERGDWTIVTRVQETQLWGCWVNGMTGEKTSHEQNIGLACVKLLERNSTMKGGEKNMTHDKYHVGDKIQITGNSNGHCFSNDHMGTITHDDCNGSTYKVDFQGETTRGNNVSPKDMRLISCVEGTMSYREVPRAAKTSMTKEAQALYRVGILDRSGEVESQATLLEALLRLNYKTLVSQAEADIKEAEEEEKAKTKKEV